MNETIEILRQYNPWDGKDISSGFKRTFYLSKIENYIGNSLVKVLTGQRRAGKSYILRQMAMDLIGKGANPKNILFINKEFSAYDFLMTNKDLNDLIKAYRSELRPEGKIYVFIDEVQNISGWETSVNSTSQDFTAEAEVFISGSNSSMLSSELATHLSGRYVNFEIMTLSYDEWIEAKGLRKGSDSYLSYLKDGGLPELLHLRGEEVKRHYVSSLKDTILLRDIIDRHQVRDSRALEDLFVYTVNNATKLFTPNSIVNFYKSKGKKISYDAVSTYLSYMSETFIIHKAERYHIQGKETIAGNCKYYINDLAFYDHLYKGFIYGYGYELENLVYLELRRKGFDVYVGNIYDSALKVTREVDFVAIDGEMKLYVQACYELKDEDTIEREYRPLELIDDSFPKYVVTMERSLMPVRNGIFNIHPWDLGEKIDAILPGH